MQILQTDTVRVFVVAPPMVSWGLERLVESAPQRLELAGSTRTGGDAASALGDQDADVLVIDVETEAELAEISAIVSTSHAKCLVVTGSNDVSLADKAILAGARGVVRTWDPPQSLLKAIEKVNEGELWIDRGATSRIFLEMARQKASDRSDPEKTRIATLTRRERQTIAAMASDASAPAKVIASRLCISEHTLRNHLTSIYSKLEVTNRLDLYAYATRHGLTELR